jgi:hypothetical protein
MKDVAKNLDKAIKSPKCRMIMLEILPEIYFSTNVETIKFLTKHGFEGIYISSHRPYENLSFLLKKQSIDIKKIFFIDIATGLALEKTKALNPRCTHISKSLSIDELAGAVYSSLSKLEAKKIFIFVDSLTSMSFYQPTYQFVMKRFFEFLAMLKEKEILIVINTPRKYLKANLVEDIEMYADKLIYVENDR